MIKSGYILSFRGDLFWFLALPFLCVAAAFAAQTWMTAVVLGSVTLWITFPHHFATWLRTFGFGEDWRRFKDQILLGPVVIMAVVFAGLKYAPGSLAALVLIWDYQHTLMQQHGFARIYDFKAGTGAPSTGRWDLALNWVLYGNLVLTAPPYTLNWIREAYRLKLLVEPSTVGLIHTASWAATGLFLVAYVWHVMRGLTEGRALNPVKYLFLGSSYFLWYFCAWQSTSLLVNGIAHKMLHGLQYIVIVYWYLRRKSAQNTTAMNRGLYQMVRPGHVFVFVAMCAFYAVAYGVMSGNASYLGLGVVNITTQYPAMPEFGMGAMTDAAGTDLFLVIIISSVGLVHYYYDSFIWKVRDVKVQAGL